MDQIWLQKMVQTACYPYAEAMFQTVVGMEYWLLPYLKLNNAEMFDTNTDTTNTAGFASHKPLCFETQFPMDRFIFS